jgi:hypothetical protein
VDTFNQTVRKFDYCSLFFLSYSQVLVPPI